MEDITLMILKIVVSICAALITVYVVPYLKTLRQDKRYASLMDMVEVAVKAAEQTIKEPGQGDYKKAEVIAFVSDWMMEHGIKISQDELSQLIECAVFSMHQEG
jgi:LL-H family phage holin